MVATQAALGRTSKTASFYEGLDFLRASAVFLVLWSHGGPLLHAHQQTLLYSAFFRPGFWGVTLFFSISGFLIVGQLLDMASGSRQESLKVFLIRRCLRTMPTYWLVILLVLLSGLVPFPPLSGLGANVVFLQGLLGVSSIVPVAWSLVIEVWSYFLFAGIALLSRQLDLRRLVPTGMSELAHAGTLLCVALLFLPVIGALLRFDLVSHGASVQELKQGLLPQIDALAYGGGLAWFQRARAPLFQRLVALPVLIPLCLALMAAMTASVPYLFTAVGNPLPEGQGFWVSFVFYPSAGLLSCLLIAASWRFRYGLFPAWAESAFRQMSRTSYSIYLLHLYVASVLGGLGVGYGVFFLYVVASILAGALGWFLLERPFTRLRYAFS